MMLPNPRRIHHNKKGNSYKFFLERKQKTVYKITIHDLIKHLHKNESEETKIISNQKKESYIF